MPERTFEKLIATIESNNPKADIEKVKSAYNLAYEAHKDQKRVSGTPYITHPLEVALIVAGMQMDVDSVCAALLHDVVEDTQYVLADIEKRFGKQVALLVDGVTKLDKIEFSNKEERDMENLRKMFLAMASDIRVIIIKFADRMHNMSTLISMSEEKQRDKARETLTVFAPLAHRLGMYKIKWELEDLSLKYLDPIAYFEIVKGINQKRQEREQYIDHIKLELRLKLADLNIDCHIDGRPKHFYSIYRKMYTQNKTLDQIYDLFAVRIITENVGDCYAALGAAHELYKPMPGRFKDYIAMPKPNMYQSLHTTVIGSDGRPFEIQIRTKEMHEIAENGIAAHWKYKEGSQKSNLDTEQKFQWVRQILDVQSDAKSEEEFLQTLRIDLFTDQVFVFSPKGDVLSFPAGSTPIDFAFSIHSAIGYKMQGAKANGKIVPLEYQMKNGDIIEIITSSAVHGPSMDWLKIIKTSQARNKINAWFKKEKREENIILGKEMIEKELKRQGISHLELNSPEYIAKIVKRYGYASEDDLFANIGYGGLVLANVIAKLKDEYKKLHEKDDVLTLALPNEVSDKPGKKSSSSNGIVVKGIQNCLIRYSQCCSPVPGDKIIGYITRGRGVSIHRQDCINIAAMHKDENERARLIDVSWEINASTSYLSKIKVVCADRNGLVLEVANVVNDTKVALKSLNARSTKDGLGIVEISVEVTNTEQLNLLIRKLSKLKDIIEVTRNN